MRKHPIVGIYQPEKSCGYGEFGALAVNADEMPSWMYRCKNQVANPVVELDISLHFCFIGSLPKSVETLVN
jgi:hypothetical protein